MKKIIALFLVAILLMMVCTGCDKKRSEKPITCQINFAKTVDKTYKPIEWYEGNEIEINTTFYAIIEFSIKNTHKKEYATVDFTVYLPHAEYYSAHEYKKGVEDPVEELIPTQDSDGNSYETVRLSGMQFGVDPLYTSVYTYCFELKAKTACDLAKIKVVFSSSLEGDTDDEMMNKNYPFEKEYSFIEKTGGEE